MSEGTNNTHNNCISSEQEQTGEYFHDSFINVVAENLVKDALQDVEHQHEEEFYDITTGLENCGLDDEESKKVDSDDSSQDEVDRRRKSATNDSSLTDDDIEVICRYSSPNFQREFQKGLEEFEASLLNKTSDDQCNVQENVKNSSETARPTEDCQNGLPEYYPQYPPPVMYLPPECYMSPSQMRPPMPDPSFYSPSMMYQQPPNMDRQDRLPPNMDHLYPPHMLESQVLQHQEMLQNAAEQLDKIDRYPSYSNADLPPPMCSNYPPETYPNSQYYDPYNNGQGSASDMNSCDYPGEPSPFVYPSIYVSSSGLITVLLRNDTSVEMTMDRTVRIVCHKSKMAVASSSRGNMSILYHPTVKIYQDGNLTNVQINGVKAKLTSEDIWFANEIGSYKFDSNMIEPSSPTYRDMSKDDSVNLLFSADTYGEKLVPQCLEAASMAEYENLPKGGVQVRINQVKITQSGRGDVVVVTGPKYLKLSPSNGLIRINTQYIEVTVEKDSSARIRKGSQIVSANHGRVILSNGRIEAGFDEHNRLKVLSLPGRSPLELGVKRSRKPSGPPRRRTSAYLMGELY